MKRFLLFGGLDYEPGGGWSDFLSDHDTIDSAVSRGRGIGTDHGVEWFHVVDTENWSIVAEVDIPKERADAFKKAKEERDKA